MRQRKRMLLARFWLHTWLPGQLVGPYVRAYGWPRRKKGN